MLAVSDGQLPSSQDVQVLLLFIHDGIGDISHSPEFLHCRCPDHMSADAINQTVLVGEHFVHLQMAANLLVKTSDFAFVRETLCLKVVHELSLNNKSSSTLTSIGLKIVEFNRNKHV